MTSRGPSDADRWPLNDATVRESMMRDDAKRGLGPADFGGLVGAVWLIGWLFTLGFIGLTPWKALLALVLWPYLLGAAVK